MSVLIFLKNLFEYPRGRRAVKRVAMASWISVGKVHIL